MPVGPYIAWVGTALVAFLLLVDWLIPRPELKPVARSIEKPIIRITSVQHLPERIDIDPSQPTIVPPQKLVEEASQPALVEPFTSATQLPRMVEVDNKRRKVAKRKGPKVAGKHMLPSTPSITDGPAKTVPLTKLSFADILSGRLVKSMLSLR
jgi:hypothetical protein